MTSKPKFNEGDRLGVWQIDKVFYSGEQFGYVYDLVRYVGVKKRGCTCTEKLLIQKFSKEKTA